MFLSTEDEQGIDAVTDLVKSTGAGGVMMWELGGDYACPADVQPDTPCGMGYTLTTRLNEKLEPCPCTLENQLNGKDEPGSQAVTCASATSRTGTGSALVPQQGC